MAVADKKLRRVMAPCHYYALGAFRPASCLYKTRTPTSTVGVLITPIKGDVWENQIRRIATRQNL